MLVKEVIVSGCRRIAFGLFKTLKYTPASYYQLILGTNGAGKSTLLQITGGFPLPSSDFEKDGWYKLVYDHRGKEYVLSVDYSHGTRCSFTIDGGDNLNPGGTQTVQRELVVQHMGYTPELHELLIGNHVFTNMSTSKRRDWFNRLNPNDMTYALSTYGKIKSAARDLDGAVKYVNGQLTKAKLEYLAFADDAELDKRVKRLQKELAKLYGLRGNTVPEIGVISADIHTAMNGLESISKQILSTLPQLRKIGVRRVSDIADEITVCDIQIRTQKTILTGKVKEHDELSNIIKKTVSNGDPRLLKIELETKRGEIQQLVATFTREPIEGLDRSQYHRTKGAVDELSAAIAQLGENPNGKYSVESLETLRRAERDTWDTWNLMSQQLGILVGRIEALESTVKVSCPECSAEFQPGVSPGELVTLETRIATGKEKVEAAKNEHATVKLELAACEQYVHRLKALHRIADSDKHCCSLYAELSRQPGFFDSPVMALGAVTDFIENLGKSYAYSERRKEFEKLEAALAIIAMVGDVTATFARNAALESDIATLTTSIAELIAKANNLKSLSDTMLKADTLLNSQRAAVSRLDKLLYAYTDATTKHAVDLTIKQQQSALALLERRLHEVHTLEETIKRLEESLAGLERDERGYKKLLAVLSPVDGLIARQQTAFITAVVTQVNRVIKDIWAYPLEVVPCGLDSGDLDYKFPFNANGIPVTEISKGSDAQKDVIDFAFKQVLMHYSGLTSHPLYCDEPGSTFDEAHRNRLLQYIKQLVESNRYTQLFMISHYAAQFGALTGADISVLDGENLSLPFKYNQQLVLTNEE